MIFAVNAGLADTVELLLTRGAEVNHRNPSTGWTALMHASTNGNLDVVNALLLHPRILIDQTDNDGTTALVCAFSNGHAAIVKRLIEAGANLG